MLSRPIRAGREAEVREFGATIRVPRPIINDMKTGVDRFSTSPLVRLAVVLGWFVITTIAFFSRYERLTPILAAGLAAVIVGVAALALTWAVWPAYRLRPGKRHRAHAKASSDAHGER